MDQYTGIIVKNTTIFIPTETTMAAPLIILFQ